VIQNERQYKITQTKLRDLLLDRSALDVPDSDLHPRLMLARKNSLNILIGELEQEIAEYVSVTALAVDNRLKSGQINK
jgi:HTH-type transcriptional regulator / antitoxin HipB